MAATVAGILPTGIHSARPAANAVSAGALYSCTTHSLIYQSDGVSTWSTWATLGSAASGSITASGYTQNTGKLLGRSTASAGAIEEITVGSNLTLSGGTLSASGGGGSVWKNPVQELIVSSANTNSQAGTWGSAPTNGNLLVLCSESEGGTNISSITQTNVTWTKVKESTASTSPHVEIWKGVVAASAGTSITVAYSGSTYCSWLASEWSGITGTLDQFAVTTNAAQSSQKTNRIPSITPGSASALVIFAGGQSSFGNSFGIYGPQLTPFFVGAGIGSTGNQGDGYAAAFGFPGAVPVYGWVYNAHGGTFSGVTVSLT